MNDQNIAQTVSMCHTYSSNLSSIMSFKNDIDPQLSECYLLILLILILVNQLFYRGSINSTPDIINTCLYSQQLDAFINENKQEEYNEETEISKSIKDKLSQFCCLAFTFSSI